MICPPDHYNSVSVEYPRFGVLCVCVCVCVGGGVNVMVWVIPFNHFTPPWKEILKKDLQTLHHSYPLDNSH